MALLGDSHHSSDSTWKWQYGKRVVAIGHFEANFCVVVAVELHFHEHAQCTQKIPRKAPPSSQHPKPSQENYFKF